MGTGIPFQNEPWFKKENTEITKRTTDYVPQAGDIIIASYPKTGTNWLHNIVLQIMSKGTSSPSINNCFCSEVSFTEVEVPEDIGEIKCLKVYKNHYGYDMVEKSPKIKILYIYRNPEDTLISWYHFLESYRKEYINLDAFFERFLEGNVEYGSYFDHVLSYLNHKDDDNLLFVSYEKLHADMRQEILRIAKFLGEKSHQIISTDESLLEKIMEHASFLYLTRNSLFSKATFQHNNPMEGSNVVIDIMDLRMDLYRRGSVGDGKRSLSLDQLKRLQRRVAETIKDEEVLREWLGE